MPKIKLSQVFQSYFGGQVYFTSESTTLTKILKEMVERHPQLAGKVCDQEGHLMPFIHAIIDGEVMDLSKGQDRELHQNSTITLLNAIAGG